MAGHKDHRERVKFRVKDRERLRELIEVEDIIGWLGRVYRGELTDAEGNAVQPDQVQLAAAGKLLDKALPNLASVELNVTGEVTTIAAEPLTAAEWAAKHGAAEDGGVVQ